MGSGPSWSGPTFSVGAQSLSLTLTQFPPIASYVQHVYPKRKTLPRLLLSESRLASPCLRAAGPRHSHARLPHTQAIPGQSSNFIRGRARRQHPTPATVCPAWYFAGGLSNDDLKHLRLFRWTSHMYFCTRNVFVCVCYFRPKLFRHHSAPVT